MSRERRVAPDEADLFRTVLKDARPLRGRPAKSGGLTETGPVERPHAHTHLAHRRIAAPALKPASPPPPERGPVANIARDRTRLTEVDGRTAERLKRGQIAPEATLDLHGLTQDEAWRALGGFVARAHAAGKRCVLVVTGKGTRRALNEDAGTPRFVMPERRAGVLREAVPRWLAEPQFRGMVVGVQGAHQRHGGSGALYVYLRRRR